MDLHELGHYQIRHDWTDKDGIRIARMQTKAAAWPVVTESGLPSYYTVKCNSRGCWACQHKAMRRLRKRVSKFIKSHVEPRKHRWRFVTLTLPGSWYEIRHADLEKQFETVKKAFASWRLKWRRRGVVISGFYVLELKLNSGSSEWHAHIHGLFEIPNKIDYSEAKRTWTESVDKPMRKMLSNWTDDTWTNDQRVVQVDRITSEGIGEYLTKVVNYTTKGSAVNSRQLKGEIAETLYRKRTNGWLGEYYGWKEKTVQKEEDDTRSTIPAV